MNDHANQMPEFDFMALLQQRIANKESSASSGCSSYPKTPFDPHQLMVKRRAENVGEISADYPIQKWPEKDIKTLEDFCKTHGIVGFSCGTMSPLAALALLKGKLGVVDQITPSESYGPNYPYSEAVKKRILLKS